MFITPLVVDDLATRHLPEQMRAATSGVFLFASYAEAGAHDATFILTALANTNATKCRFSEAAVIVWKFEVRFRLPGRVIRAKTQVSVHAIWTHQLSRVHFPVRVPEGLEFLECFHQFRAKHHW